MTGSTYTPADDLDRLQASAELHAAQDARNIESAVDYLDNAGCSPPYIVLDVGCGFGTVTHRQFGDDPRFEVIGVDRNREALQTAVDEYSASNIEYIQADVDSLPETIQHPVDIVFTSYLLHHVDGARTTLHNLWNMVRPVGALVARSCDDGQHMQYPESEDIKFIVNTTDWLTGSSDRTHGRRLYTEMKDLSPPPLDVRFDVENYHTAGCSKEMREKYWTVFHSSRIHYARVNAEKERNDDESRKTISQELYEHMSRCMERAREHVVENESTMDIKSVPMAVAYKHPANGTDA